MAPVDSNSNVLVWIEISCRLILGTILSIIALTSHWDQSDFFIILISGAGDLLCTIRIIQIINDDDKKLQMLDEDDFEKRLQ